ncbi:MAG: UDP-2,3-diacylglucosamine diphosphatase LpxI [Proteobacteria bacterium]|nr:UDP-2,3-diacylglucosamine diphosphatase LpxI [Pseudomonadota bacterium]
MTSWRKLGLIAGGGDLPIVLAEHCAATGRDYFVARIEPFANATLERHPGVTLNLGEMGVRMQALKDAGVDAVVLIGQVSRPDLSQLKLDERAQAMIPAFLAAASKGDDALLRVLLEEHEREGFKVLGAEEVMGDLLTPAGVWGAISPTDAQRKDIAKAAKIAAAIGTLDVGQGVVVAGGVPLAVEAQEGTDAMLARVATLPTTVRGTSEDRRGVLLKRPKPIQERRIDLPVVGLRTLAGAADAGLAGIAVEAQGALAVRRDEMIAEANRLGMFLYGFTRVEVGEM